jgi:hypothetical protein
MSDHVVFPREPECCGTSMIHNSSTGRYECSDAYFALIGNEEDPGVADNNNYGGLDLLMPPNWLTEYESERWEHWHAFQISDDVWFALHPIRQVTI